MIKAGDKIRLDRREQKLLSDLAMEPVNPQTTDDLEAWVEHAVQNIWNEETPEDRLMRAILQDFKTAPE